MGNIEIVKVICKELGDSESLIQQVIGRKGHNCCYALTRRKSIKN